MKLDLQTYTQLKNSFEKGFFGFWIRQYRISYLIVICILVLGISSLIKIPKESFPTIKFGMVSIVTVDIGTNPTDIDLLITDKIYKEIKDIKGIDKITSSSSLGVSAISATLKTDADTKDVINEIRNNVNRVSLPSEAKTPVITEIDTDSKRTFSIYIYAKKPDISRNILIDRAKIVQKNIEKISGVESVKFAGVSIVEGAVAGGSQDRSEYDVEFVVPYEKLQLTGLTLDSISSTIRAWNKDLPVGNYGVGDKNYDFRIQGKMNEILPFLEVPLTLQDGSVIKLGDIVNIERKYKDQSIQAIGFNNSADYYDVVGLAVNKVEGASIFDVSDKAKEQIKSLFASALFQDFGYEYGNDLADNIIDDYKELAKEALITLVLVFVTMYLFVGFKDSLFATITLPLAFFSTFIILNSLGFSLNFLTNFSLILSFGIAVDTIIVIVQAASAKMRVGYAPGTAVLLGVKEYSIPIISGVLTTIVVFIPMMTLPGILGKFLAYIPITIFGVLATGLVLALTVNSALYLLFVKNKDSYVESGEAIEYASEEELQLLEYERQGKKKITVNIPLRLRVIKYITESYKNALRYFLENTFLRRGAIFLPVLILILSFVFLAPRVGFELFPGDDNGAVSFEIQGDNGLRSEDMAKKIVGIEKIVTQMPEVKFYTFTISGNTANLAIQLTKKYEREALGQRDAFAIEAVVMERLKVYEKSGLKVVSKVAKNGPPGSKAIGLKVIAQNPEQLPILVNVAKDFEKQLKTLSGTKNVGISSKDTPGQFVFTLNKQALSEYNISPLIIYGYISQMMNGVTLGTLEADGDDIDIVLRQSNFREKIDLQDVLNATFIVGNRTYQLGNFISYDTKNAIESITRENGKISITIDADLEPGVDSVGIQTQYEEFAKSYSYPPGISYAKGGENEENKELISAVMTSFFIAVVVIFAILTLQFNSFSQPVIVLYSVVMALPFVMVGLILTDNKFSLPFGIGFIAFTGISVNHGIILIDAINQNLKKGMESFTALIEAGSSRLEPMALTTFTTMLGILPIALRDKFWSGMGFTIIFGIFAASCLTLFVLKAIYYEVYIEKTDAFYKRWFRFIYGVIKSTKYRRKNRI